MTKAKNSDQVSVVSDQTPVQVQPILLERLNESRNNPRKTMDEAGLQELAASIREHGVNVPLLIRAIDMGDAVGLNPQYEIVCGHRRADAATMAGLLDVPCIVRALDDQAAAELALIDNLQRVDVPAMEEAEAFGALYARLGSIPAVAAKVGKDQAYVAKSLKLLTLTPWSQDALRGKLITIDHARLLARLAEAEQNEALKWCLDTQAGSKKPVEGVIKGRLKRKYPAAAKAKAQAQAAANGEEFDGEGLDDDFDDDADEETGRRSVWNREWECESVQRLKEHIECESGEPLDRAPWPMEEDWLLPDAGSCLDCPKNTKVNAPLFGDLDMGVAVCTDGACFKAKIEGFVLHSIDTSNKTLDGQGAPKPVLRVSWKLTSTAPRQLKNGGGVNPAQTFKDGQWIEATKKCEHARAAVTVDWGDMNNRGHMGSDGKLRKPGEPVLACIEPVCKVHAKAYIKAAKSSGNQREKPETEEDRKAREAKRALFERVEPLIRSKVMLAILGKLDAAKAIHMVADNSDRAPKWRKHILASFPKLSGNELEAFTAFCCEFSNGMHVNNWQMAQAGGVSADRKNLWKLAAELGVKADEVAAKYFHDEYADSSSLASLAPAGVALYPKGVKWPQANKSASKPVAKTAVKKATKKAAKKTAVKKAAKKGGR